MTRQQQQIATTIEAALCPEQGRLSPRNWKAVIWFLDFIDHAVLPDDVNAYVETLDQHELTLLTPIV